MFSHSRVSLEQWRSLVAVVDAGGYAAAAEQLDKSQSSVTYAIRKLESSLGVAAFTLSGRRAVLTPTGQLLYQRARQLLDEAARLEQAARQVSAGWEAQLGLAVEVLFPTWLLLDCLSRFGGDSPHTHIELYETVISGSQELLLEGRAQLAVTPHVPAGFIGEPLMDLRFVPVAHPEHPLHQLQRPLALRDLRRHRHLLVRESGISRSTDPGIRSEQRWTVSNMPTSIGAACRGYGYAWFPEHKIRRELAEGVLKPLPMDRNADRFVTMYLVLGDPESPGPGVSRLAEILREACGELCEEEQSG